MTDGRGNRGFKAHLSHRCGCADVNDTDPVWTGRRSQLSEGLKLAARFVYNPRLVVCPTPKSGSVGNMAIDTAHLRCGNPRRADFARPVQQCKHSGMPEQPSWPSG